MIRHHAPDELLLDYAAGVLPEGPALAVAGLCAACGSSQSTVASATAIPRTPSRRPAIPDR